MIRNEIWLLGMYGQPTATLRANTDYVGREGGEPSARQGPGEQAEPLTEARS